MGGTGRAPGAGTAAAAFVVAVAAERVMANKSDVLHRQRGKMLNYARVLARSGEYSDHKSIIPLLTALEDGTTVRRWLEDRTFRTQLDKLCAMARDCAP
jgi:hypothetical protein